MGFFLPAIAFLAFELVVVAIVWPEWVIRIASHSMEKHPATIASIDLGGPDWPIPQDDRILVRRLSDTPPPPLTTPALAGCGLFEVLASGPGRVTPAGTRMPTDMRSGDRVILGRPTEVEDCPTLAAIVASSDIQARVPRRSITSVGTALQYASVALADARSLILVSALAYALALILLALNRGLYRFKEGYGRYNPLRLLSFVQRQRYRQLKRNADAFPDASAERQVAMLKLAEDYPIAEEFLLPTAFGNTIRAFETYPYALYGVDGVVVWDRLVLVLPETARQVAETAKSQVDFWLNLWWFALFGACQVLVLGAFAAPSLGQGAFLLAAVSLPLSHASRSAAREWGNVVRSCFDVYLPELRRVLGLRPVKGDLREMWIRFGTAAIYRDGSELPPTGAETARCGGPFE